MPVTTASFDGVPLRPDVQASILNLLVDPPPSPTPHPPADDQQDRGLARRRPRWLGLAAEMAPSPRSDSSTTR